MRVGTEALFSSLDTDVGQPVPAPLACFPSASVYEDHDGDYDDNGCANRDATDRTCRQAVAIRGRLILGLERPGGRGCHCRGGTSRRRC